uniref:Uncharacterized protein heh2 n=1 Tax=Nakaseomyces delphensis TaxID=51657 RepID=A7WPG6_NAKDE|nr:hypothetical protein [Nakaseomyces delphensis]
MSESASKLTAAQLRRILTENNVAFPSKAKKAVLAKLYTANIEAKGVEVDIEGVVASVKKEATRQRKKKLLELRNSKKGQKHALSDNDADEIDGEKTAKKVKRAERGSSEPYNKEVAQSESKNETASPAEAAGIAESSLNEDSEIEDSYKSDAKDINIQKHKSNNSNNEHTETTKPVRRSRRHVSSDENNEDKKLGEQKEEEPALAKVVSAIKNDIKEELAPEKEEFVANERTGRNGSDFYSFLNHGLKYIFKLLIFLMPILFGIWYRDQKFQVGFCGHELPVQRFQSPNDQLNIIASLDKSLERFLPECMPCPKDAVCTTHLQVHCEPGFRKVHNWKSLHGLLPFPDHCVKNAKLDNIPKKITPLSFALKVLRERNAENSCGRTSENDHQAALLERELYSRVWQEFKDSVNSTAFQNEWSTLIKQLKKSQEIQTQTIVVKNGVGSVEKHLLLRSFSTSEVSYVCMLGMFIRNIPIEKRSILLSLVIFVASAVLEFIIQKLAAHCLKESHFVNEAVKKAILKLQDTKSNEDITYLDTIQLREYLLCDVHNLQEKNRLWQKISGKLAENENVDTRIVELYGDVLRIWEWNS